jgi:uncharacterized membrane protein YciS (DUF1049 family)
MRYLKLFVKLMLVAVLLLIGILAGMDNSDAVALKFLDWQTPHASMFAWVAGALILGVVLGMALSTGVNLRSAWRERGARRALELSEQQVEQLKVTKE